MRKRFTLLLVLTFIFSLLPVVGAYSNIGTSTEGFRVLRVPGNDAGAAVAINDNGWIALETSVWKGIGYPTDLQPALSAIDPGGGSLQVTDMSPAGEVVGGFRSVFQRSFSWIDGVGMQDIGLQRAVLTPTSIDRDGTIVLSLDGAIMAIGRPGSFTTFELPGMFPQAIDGGLAVGGGTWTSGGGFVELQGNGVGYDANASGTIAGRIVETGGISKAVYWPSKTAAPVNLGVLLGDTMSQATAINDSGWIVGWSSTSADPAVARRAFLWRPGIGMEDLGFFPGDSTADAFDINNAGVIVGTSGDKPVVWDVNGVFNIDYPPEVEPFGDVLGEDQSDIIGISAGNLLDRTIVISDFEGDPFTATWSGLPAGATWDGVSSLTWPTAPGDEGNYPVSLTVTQDSQPLNTITIDVTIVVSPPGPILAPIGDQNASVGQELTFTVTATPSAPGSILTFAMEAPTAMAATLDPVTGFFSWTPVAGDIGQHTVMVAVVEDFCPRSDPGCGTQRAFDTETFTITVTDVDQPPVLIPIVETINEFETLTISRSAFLSDPDTPINDITLTLEPGDDPVPPDALINGIFEWTPGETDGGRTFSFIMRAADTATPPNEVTAPITITVLETNEAPVIDLIPPQTIGVGQTLNLVVTATDADIPTDTLVFSLVESQGSIDPVIGAYTLTPNSTGTITISLLVTDGTVDAVADFTVTVTGGNSPPEPVQDSYTAVEDSPLFVETPGVLLNDRDAEGDQMIAVQVDPPLNGKLQLDETGGFRYDPDPNFNGTDFFTYYAYDGLASVTTEVRISVAPVNDDPVIEAIPDVEVLEGFTVELSPTFSDVDEDPLSSTWVGDIPPNASTDGGFVLTTTENQGGQTFNIEFVVTDGNGGEAREPVTITVVETNQPPSLVSLDKQEAFTGDDVLFDVDATDPDLPANALVYSLEGAPPGATIDPASGEFTWVNAMAGTFTFDIVVTDDGAPPLEDRMSMTIVVVDPANLPNDVSVELSVLSGDPDGDGIVDVGQPVTLRATVRETNLGAFNTEVAFLFPGDASLMAVFPDVCESFSIVGTGTVLSCAVGSVFGSVDLDVTVTLDDTRVYDIVAEVTTSNPETDTTNNTDGLSLEAQIRVFITELVGASDTLDVVPPLNLATILEAIGVTDLLDVVPPLNLATILEAIAVGDLTDVVPPLTLATILEAIGVIDSTDVVPPLSLATILENIAVTDSPDVIYDSDGNGIPDTTATAVDPFTGAIVDAVVPGTEILVTAGGFVPGSSVSANLFSDPIFLGETVADENGVVALVVTIPSNTPAGEHRIVLSGEWKNGGPFEVIFPIEVLGVCTITGTSGRDILIGTRGDDVICGFGGNDIIIGRGGDDRIFGGDGRDILLGGRGDDALYGENGNDILLGGRGNDYLDGGPGADLLIGGRGRDTKIQ